MKLDNYHGGFSRPQGLCSVFVLSAVLSLTACGGSSVQGLDPTDPGNNTNNQNNNGNQNPDTTETAPKLAAVAADSLIKSSMLGFYTDTGSANGSGGIGIDVAVLESSQQASSADSSDSGGGGARFSDTNVQEAGVDESDRVKIDGNVLFALERPSPGVNGVFPVEPLIDVASDSISILPYDPPSESLSAYRLSGDNSSLLARMSLDLGFQTPEGMYLHKNGGNRDLVLISRGSFSPWEYWADTAAFSGAKTRVTWINANSETDLKIGRTLEVDGQLISSRKINNRLILVTRYHPQLIGIQYPYNEEVAANNRSQIEAADADTLLPKYTLQSGGTTTGGSVISDNRCYKSGPVPDDTATTDPQADQAILPYDNPSVISIITVDLNDQNTTINNTCFVGDTETMYVSQNALYLATTQYDYGFSTDALSRPVVDFYPPEITTEIHKFSFGAGGAPDFRGSGSVSGHLGWYPMRKPFRMSEKDNNLRVVTFDQDRSGSPVTLNILSEGDGATMRTLSTLPNANRPDPIGKPGENLYASRFIGDRAYLVTFRVTDPLYVLDVSDPFDPLIAGELELPGYSDYLHPVSDSLLVGVGKDAIADNGTGWGDGRGAWYQGVKLALFDVSDPSAPFVADSKVIGKRGTETPALYNHHSFAWLPGQGQRNARLAMPLSLHAERTQQSDPAAWSEWTSNNMLTMEVDEAATAFVDVPNWTFETRSAGHRYNPIDISNDRAVIGSDGGLYVIHNGSLSYGQWGNSAPTSTTR